MSETVLETGKLVVLRHSLESSMEYAETYLNKQPETWDDNDWYDDPIEMLIMEYSPKFVYHNETLYQTIDYNCSDDVNYLIDAHLNVEDEIEFTLIYYNGIANFIEVMDDALNGMEK